MNLRKYNKLMYPLTHIYYAKQIVENPTPLTFYGTIFPDIPSTKIISWETMKQKTVDFSNFIKFKDKQYSDFASGLLLHEENLGIDRFVHGNKGFAYINGRKLVKHLKPHFPESNILDIAHSFIEFAIEIRIIKNNPELMLILKTSIEEFNKRCKIVNFFSEYFKTDFRNTKNSITLYNKVLYEMDISSFQKAVIFYTWINKNLRGINVDEEIISSVLVKANNIVKDTDKEFLNKVINKGKKDYQIYLQKDL